MKSNFTNDLEETLGNYVYNLRDLRENELLIRRLKTQP